MSRRNYIHTVDALIGKPYYSNAAGAVLDPNTGLEVPTTDFREQVPTNDTIVDLPPIVAVTTTENSDLEGMRIQEERRKLEAERLASLSEAEKAERLRRIELAKANYAISQEKIKARKLAESEANKQVVINKFSPPPIILGGGGGGGGAIIEPETAKPSNVSTVKKPSFLNKNFFPILLVATAIYVFVKKPIN